MCNVGIAVSPVFLSWFRLSRCEKLTPRGSTSLPNTGIKCRLQLIISNMLESPINLPYTLHEILQYSTDDKRDQVVVTLL